MDPSPFHEGERDAQRRAGVEAHGGGIRDWMTEPHRAFFAGLPFVVAGAAAGEGWPVATMLAGPLGFVASPDPWTLRVAALPDPADPAAPGFAVGAPVALLGIDLATRRRNRANGRIAVADASGFAVAVEQSFGNCPQYIQAREVGRGGGGTAAPGETEGLAGLDAEARALIGAADTFFVASTAGGGSGFDVSHRGGRPGFVRVDGDVLTIPDFRGNRYFNTLGNFLLDPRAGLLFVDFARGDLLHIIGRVEVLWDSGEAGRGFVGAERLWRVRVWRAWRRRGKLPLRWRFEGFAPTTERTGCWAASA